MMLPHAEELSRAISDLNLNHDLAFVRSVETEPKNGHPEGNSLSLGTNMRDLDGQVEAHEVKFDGMKTPPDLPAAPPPTPEILPNPREKTPHVEGGPEGEQEGGPEAAAISDGKSKKKKKKRSGKNGKPAATGFEEFYADPPITPDEHEEESDLYAPSRSFSNRIETCIQRYRARRKLDEVRANILTKYFALGGIDSSHTKAFTGGLDRETLQNSTAQEIAAIQATDYIRSGIKNSKFYDSSDSANWAVDFESVVKGFLSYRIPRQLGADNEKDIKTYCSVIKNFLNYVHAHGVCIEYTEDVLAARKICDLAEKELWALQQVRSRLPGDFNIAASTLHGCHYQGLHLGNQPWAMDNPNFEEYVAAQPGVSDSEAERIFKTAIAFAGSDDLFSEIMGTNVHVIGTETRCFEIIEIVRADLKTLEDYAAVKNPQGVSGLIKPLGVIKLQVWEGPNLDEEDMTDDEELKATTAVMESNIESFWLEDEILQYCFLGMKLELIVHELNVGLKFFDTVVGLYCSFHTFLPNEKMINWKEPDPNLRPPPTEKDPDAEENAIQAIVEREVEDMEHRA